MVGKNSSTEANPGARTGMGSCKLSSGQSSERWSAFNIAGVVLGFIVLGPFGLFVLFWVLAGRDVVEIPSALRSLWHWIKAQKEGGQMSG